MRKFAPLIVVAFCCATPFAKGAAYSGTVLYQLTAPTGFSPKAFTANRAMGGEVAGSATTTHRGRSSVVWVNSTTTVDLHPSGNYILSHAIYTNGIQQVGSVDPPGIAGILHTHAMLWTGTAASAVDLNPHGFTDSVAGGVAGTQQVGQAYVNQNGQFSNEHAMLWTGTAASAVDLNPTNFATSEASGTDGIHQVGQGLIVPDSTFWHALLWSGTAASAVDLHPATGINESGAFGTGGNQQVGYGIGSATGLQEHALLWTGTAASVVDLHPSGFISSEARATNGVEQVGYASTSSGNQAMLWLGTPQSVVNLQTLLPTGHNFSSSFADGIDSAGNIYGTAMGSVNGTNATFAVEWTPVPEPASILLLALGSLGLLNHRRRLI